MNHISHSELDHLISELNVRFNSLIKTLAARTPKTKLDGIGNGKRYWIDPEKVRIFESTATERKLAVDDFSAILRRISAIK